MCAGSLSSYQATHTMSPSKRVGRIFSVVFLFLVSVIGVKTIGKRGPTRWLHEKLNTPATVDTDPHCVFYPDPGNIAIAVKTGATEATEKIPTLMLTSLRCAQDVTIFSDLKQTVAGHHIRDALAAIPQEALDGNPDFDFYWKLREAQKYGQIETMLKGTPNPHTTGDSEAWNLDKYKNLHILEALYAQHPDKDWYLLIDADTYLVWPNVLSWLQRLPDPSATKLYLGAPANGGDVEFGHGGSGVLMSHATMYELTVKGNGSAAQWDKPMRDVCCGDLAVGRVLKEFGIILKPSWPTVNGEKPITIPFEPTHWCQPVVSKHHVQPYEMDQLAKFQILRKNSRIPLTFAELFDFFTRDVLPSSMDECDNHPHGAAIEVESYETCGEACNDDSECFQFSFNGKLCSLGYSIHLGEPVRRQNGMTLRSGWLNGRIEEWYGEQPPCAPPKFPWTEKKPPTLFG